MSREEWVKDMNKDVKRLFIHILEMILQSLLWRLELVAEESEDKQEPEKKEEKDAALLFYSWLVSKKAAITKKREDQSRARIFSIRATMETDVSLEGQKLSEGFLEGLFDAMRDFWLNSFSWKGRHAEIFLNIVKEIYEEEDFVVMGVKILSCLDTLYK